MECLHCEFLHRIEKWERRIEIESAGFKPVIDASERIVAALVLDMFKHRAKSQEHGAGLKPSAESSEHGA